MELGTVRILHSYCCTRFSRLWSWSEVERAVGDKTIETDNWGGGAANTFLSKYGYLFFLVKGISVYLLSYYFLRTHFHVLMTDFFLTIRSTFGCSTRKISHRLSCTLPQLLLRYLKDVLRAAPFTWLLVTINFSIRLISLFNVGFPGRGLDSVPGTRGIMRGIKTWVFVVSEISPAPRRTLATWKLHRATTFSVDTLLVHSSESFPTANCNVSCGWCGQKQ